MEWDALEEVDQTDDLKYYLYTNLLAIPSKSASLFN